MRELDGRSPRRPEADRRAVVARGDPARPRLRLHANLQRLRGPDRRPGARAARARPGRGRACIRCARPIPPRSPRAELARRSFASGGGRRPELAGMPGFDGGGVTIALLDTGVDVTSPLSSATGCSTGLDMLDPDGARHRAAPPGRSDAARASRHADGRADRRPAAALRGIRGVAPGASILPIRVAGWQPNADGGFAVYSRTDQLLAGLERAVDPDADGDVLDAARIAVVGVTEPFASFADGPVARRGRRRRPAGHARRRARRERRTGRARLRQHRRPRRGSGRAHGRRGRPAPRDGDGSRRRPVGPRASCSTGSFRSPAPPAPRAPLSLAVARPRRDAATGPRGTLLARYFDDRGYSVVAGRAALIARATGPTDDARGCGARRGGRDPRRRGRPGRGARPRRPSRRSRRRPAAVRRRCGAHGPRPRGGRPRLARGARLAGERAADARSPRSPRTAWPSAAASSRRSPSPASSW